MATGNRESLKRMVEGLALSIPVDELDRELVGGVASRHPFVLSKAQRIEEQLDGAEGGFAHADAAEVSRLDYCQVNIAWQCFVEIRRGHPTSGASSDNHD